MQTAGTTIIRADVDMSSQIVEWWSCMQKDNSDLASPYFSPEFTRIVAKARDDVEVGIMEDGGKIVAVFPFERRRWGFAGPVGSFISDYHGVITRPDFVFDPRDLLRACGLVAWDFNHIPAVQAPFVPFHREQHRSPIIDLSAGYEAYVKERRGAGTELINNANLKMRRLERDVGPLRFVAHSSDKALLAKLLTWKSEQFRHNRWRDIFSVPWVRQTVEGIHAAQTPEFAGMLSALYAGDQLVAAHFGMRSSTVWHYWFPSYDPAFSKYSPGVILLLKMAESASALGVNVIDLGCGEHAYKERFMNGYVLTAKGIVEVPCLTTAVRRVITPVSKIPFNVRRWVSKTPLGAALRQVRKRVSKSGVN